MRYVGFYSYRVTGTHVWYSIVREDSGSFE